MSDNTETVVDAEPPFYIEPLKKAHDRKAFSCGSEPLERYLKTQVTQDVRRRIAKCSVLVEASSGAVCGFYTLSATNMSLSTLPDALLKGLPRYPVVPAVLIGRLAVAISAQGKKLARAMLVHAVEAVSTSPIGVFAIVVDAKDDNARAFYERHGFTPLKDEKNRLILPIETAIKMFGNKPGD